MSSADAQANAEGGAGSFRATQRVGLAALTAFVAILYAALADARHWEGATTVEIGLSLLALYAALVLSPLVLDNLYPKYSTQHVPQQDEEAHASPATTTEGAAPPTTPMYNVEEGES